MDIKDSARKVGKTDRACVNREVNQDIIRHEYERGTFWGGILMGVSFGIMFLIGAWCGW